MPHRDIVLEAIRSAPDGLTDAEIVERTGIRPHQQVNQICRRLADAGAINRKLGTHGWLVNRLSSADGHVLGESGIEVTEATDGYLVKIRASEKERAKGIVGRRWDWESRRWVYPKSTRCYEALADEFRADADVFDITAPSPPADQPPLAPQADDPADAGFPEPAPSPSHEPAALGELYDRLVSVMDGIDRLERSVDEVRTLVDTESNEASEDGDEPTQPEAEDGPDTVLFEQGLGVIASYAAKKDPSFREWVNNVRPIGNPYEFVSRSHEMLKEALVEFGGGDVTASARFGNLVADLRDRDLLPRRPLNVPQTLFAMNDHRNWFAHPTGTDNPAERLARSAIYLLNLALVWPLVSTPVEE